MDGLITAAARALASGDALGALNYVALRDDPPALALRGIAMAQLGELPRARLLLRQAARAFGNKELAARARCLIAEAEIALVSRDLGWPLRPLATARQVLIRRGDIINAAHARHLETCYLVLVGRLEEAARLLEAFDPSPLPLASMVAHELVVAGIAMRRLQIKAARAALARARGIARETRISSLGSEVESAGRALDAPAARRIASGQVRLVRLDDVEAMMSSKMIVADACRRAICHSGKVISLATRPVLFALARALAESWPGGASRAALLERVFRAKHADESHRARLRVEIGRLRKMLHDIASIEATKDGFALVPRASRDVVVLAPLVDEAHATVLALLADGETWSSSALALALGASQRTVQRALDDLLAEGRVQAVGRGRARRWMAPPVPGFPTTLLLPAVLSSG
jgi:hypothetical protein